MTVLLVSKQPSWRVGRAVCVPSRASPLALVGAARTHFLPHPPSVANPKELTLRQQPPAQLPSHGLSPDTPTIPDLFHFHIDALLKKQQKNNARR